MANGINTVEIDGKVVHITDLEPTVLMQEWSKKQRELSSLYEANHKATKGWRGIVLKLIGVHLPVRQGVFKFEE